jgi:hypothetical protein
MSTNLNYRHNEGVVYMAVDEKCSISLECDVFLQNILAFNWEYVSSSFAVG